MQFLDTQNPGEEMQRASGECPSEYSSYSPVGVFVLRRALAAFATGFDGPGLQYVHGPMYNKLYSTKQSNLSIANVISCPKQREAPPYYPPFHAEMPQL